jgi:deoxyribodipyrimidine photolyase-related protein
MEAALIFPHQLFEEHPAFKKDRLILLIEDPRFFSDFAFHKKKLVFHRASLKSFDKALQQKGFRTQYVEEDLELVLKNAKVDSIHFVELDDFSLSHRITSLAKKQHLKIELYPSPGFFTSNEEFSELFSGKKHLICQSLYIYQRKKLNLLLDDYGKPIGGKWSFDAENRKKVPAGLQIPEYPRYRPTEDVIEAQEYVKRKYPLNPGSCEDFNYATTHKLAKKSLINFLENRLHSFGEYEDAIVQKEELLFHSGLSCLLNVGLLTPQQVIDETLAFSSQHEIPINSLEGLIRQLIGWREFVRGVYHLFGQEQRKKNYFNHHRQIPKAFYEGTTGILPIDSAITKLHKNGYLHHIERLMLLGNFFLLCEVSPSEVYRWFMELFIDSYDWVMVPNVYGMSQYADGGMMTTKPYFSGSNYILKMSDYKKGDWCPIWDALFWRFMIKHEEFFASQPRLKVLHQMAMNKKQDQQFLKTAENFLDRLFSS